MNNSNSSTIWVQAYREVEYRFDDLLAHLENYGAKKAVAISEGATRVIARADNYNKLIPRNKVISLLKIVNHA